MAIPIDANRRLQAYIASRTRILPEDIQAYKAGGVYEHCCLFCQNSASTYEVRSTGIDTGTYMCTICRSDYFDKVSKISYDEDIKKKLLLDSLDEECGFELPFDVKKYLTHLTSNETYGTHTDRCYSCDRFPVSRPYDSEEFSVIEIPIRHDKIYVAGYVHLCDNDECQNLGIDYNYALKKLFKTFTTSREERKACTVQCPTCRSHYTILGNENRYRLQLGDSYEFQCPLCVQHTLHKWQKTPQLQFLYPFKVEDKRDQPLQRFSNRLCYYCNNWTLIDLTQTEFSIYNNHLIDNNWCCKNCSLLRNWIGLPTVHKILDSTIYLELHNTDYTFSIFRLCKGALESVIINGQTGADNEIDAIFIAFREVGNLLGEIDLWKNGD